MDSNSSIILVGMMASGKSTIGKLLSEKLNFDYLDTDLIIERQENKTCNEIF